MKVGIPVPYVDVIEYMNMVYDPDNVFSLSSQGKGVYEISNAKDSMTVDTDYSNFRNFELLDKIVTEHYE